MRRINRPTHVYKAPICNVYVSAVYAEQDRIARWLVVGNDITQRNSLHVCWSRNAEIFQECCRKIYRLGKLHPASACHSAARIPDEERVCATSL